jgi:lipid II:glycine glycyltransferase (peptidoglycan interpeptide bridge formation enzyme)
MRDVFAATKNYEPAILATEMDGEIEDLLLGCIIKEGEGLKGAFSSRAIVVGGPLSKRGDIREIVEAFDEVVGPDSLYAQFRNLRTMSSRRPAFEELGYAYEDHINYVHDLTKPVDEIWKGFNTSRRRGIKKAEKGGVMAREAEGDEDVEILYELLKETYEMAGVPVADKSLFVNTWRVLKPANMIRIVLGAKGKDTVAGRLYLTYRGTIYEWYAGSSSAGKEEHANEFLVWDTMQWGSRNGFRLFDFGGAGKRGEDYGPGEFKRLFGGTMTSFGRFEKTFHPVKHFVGRKGYDVLRRLG